MNTEQVQTFLAVVTHGNFINAARQLHVDQSTVSTRIQQLEREFNTFLFVCNHTDATLTPAGLRFITHAKRWVSVVEQARWDIGMMDDEYEATVRIGGTVALWLGFWSELVRLMRQDAPNIVIQGKILPEDILVQQVMDRQLDIGLLNQPVSLPELIVESLYIQGLEGSTYFGYLIYLAGCADKVVDQTLDGLRKVTKQ